MPLVEEEPRNTKSFNLIMTPEIAAIAGTDSGLDELEKKLLALKQIKNVELCINAVDSSLRHNVVIYKIFAEDVSEQERSLKFQFTVEDSHEIFGFVGEVLRRRAAKLKAEIL